MTPGNIAGMASIKGLDVIAVTDHNSCRNCPAVMKFAQEYGVLAIPGMEINTSEEVHAVCLFPTLEAALNFDGYVYERLMKFPNRKEIFGKQQICNEEDICVAEEPNLLINSTDISFDRLWEPVSYTHLRAHDRSPSRGLGDVYKRQAEGFETAAQGKAGQSLSGGMPDYQQFRCPLSGAYSGAGANDTGEGKIR